MFQRSHAPGDPHADEREQDDDAKHAIGLEARGKDLQGLAEAMYRGNDLPADDAEQGENESKAQAIEDDGDGGGQNELAENLVLAGSQRLRKHDVIGID